MAFPAPLAPDLMAIHGASAAAVHVHFWLDALTWTVPLPPDIPKSAEAGDSSNLHSPAAWLTTARCPATTIPPLRVTGSELAAALNCTVPSPCPLPPDMTLNHSASVDAVHWHSRAAATVTLPLPPPAGIVEPGLPTVTEHLDSAEGEVTVLVSDPHAAMRTAPAKATGYNQTENTP